jgi:hypothetical protein
MLTNKDKRETRMILMQSTHRTINSIAKQLGLNACGWLSINGSSYDRTPSEFRFRVREEGSYC